MPEEGREGALNRLAALLVVVQAELRGHTAGRLGVTLFGGFAQVAGELLHLRLDCAWRRDGGLLYFSVGEAF